MILERFTKFMKMYKFYLTSLILYTTMNVRLRDVNLKRLPLGLAVRLRYRCVMCGAAASNGSSLLSKTMDLLYHDGSHFSTTIFRKVYS